MSDKKRKFNLEQLTSFLVSLFITNSFILKNIYKKKNGKPIKDRIKAYIKSLPEEKIDAYKRLNQLPTREAQLLAITGFNDDLTNISPPTQPLLTKEQVDKKIEEQKKKKNNTEEKRLRIEEETRVREIAVQKAQDEEDRIERLNAQQIERELKQVEQDLKDEQVDVGIGLNIGARLTAEEKKQLNDFLKPPTLSQRTESERKAVDDIRRVIETKNVLEEKNADNVINFLLDNVATILGGSRGLMVLKAIRKIIQKLTPSNEGKAKLKILDKKVDSEASELEKRFKVKSRVSRERKRPLTLREKEIKQIDDKLKEVKQGIKDKIEKGELGRNTQTLGYIKRVQNIIEKVIATKSKKIRFDKKAKSDLKKVNNALNGLIENLKEDDFEIVELERSLNTISENMDNVIADAEGVISSEPLSNLGSIQSSEEIRNRLTLINEIKDKTKWQAEINKYIGELAPSLNKEAIKDLEKKIDTIQKQGRFKFRLSEIEITDIIEQAKKKIIELKKRGLAGAVAGGIGGSISGGSLQAGAKGAIAGGLTGGADTLGVISSAIVGGLSGVFAGFTPRIIDPELQQTIQQNESGKGTLRPKFITPSTKILELSQKEYDADIDEWDAFDYVQPGTEGGYGTAKNNILKASNLTEKKIRYLGGGIYIGPDFGKNVVEESVEKRYEQPSLPRPQLRPMEFNIGRYDSENYEVNNESISVGYKNPYRFYTNVRGLNQEIESSVLFGRVM